MSEELPRKKRVRAGHKASATRNITRAEALLAEDDPDVSTLTQIKMSLREKLDTLRQLDSEIVNLLEDEAAVVDDIEQADTFKEGVYSTMIRIERYLETAKSTTTEAGSRDSPSSTRVSKARLPKLTIRPFSGDLAGWTTFWDSYQTAIHDNHDLSAIDKFNYLRSLLQGSALESIAGLTLSSSNYEEAIAILKKRFGNKQRIIARHMDLLLNVDPVKAEHDLKSLRHLYDLVESHVRSLRSLGVPADSYGALLSSVVLNKLPPGLRLIISRNTSSEELSFEQLLKAVEEEIQARERTSLEPSTQMRKPRDTPTAAALLSGSSGNGPTCSYCRQTHPSASCRTVVQVDDRKRILRKTVRCFVCLRRGHVVKDCRSNVKCLKCSGRHHVSICPKGSDQPVKPANDTDVARQEVETSTSCLATNLNPEAPPFSPTTTSLWMNSNRTTLLQTAQATLFNPSDPEVNLCVRLVMDSGSQRSYVTTRVKEELALIPEGEQCMSVATFGSHNASPQAYEGVKVGIRLKDGQSKCLMLLSVPHICEPLTSQPISICQEEYEHLKGLELADASDGQSGLCIDVLIGLDSYWEIVTGEIRRGSGGPVAIHTHLGWVLSGPVTFSSLHLDTASLVTHTLRVDAVPQQAKNLDDQLKSFWDLESFGVNPTEGLAHDEFSESIVFKNGRYEVALPWKKSHPPLSDNYDLSLKRLHGLLRRLRQDDVVLDEYDSIIQSQIQQGIVEVVEKPEQMTSNKIHYLPHHAVIRRDKNTTKLRIVYDASAKSDGPSLNDCLHAGPKFDQKIFDLLLRFRVHKIAVTADIEKAFLMISMKEEDRDVLRFLWVSDVRKDDPQVIILRFTRVVFGVSSSPFLLNATIRHHLENRLSSNPDIISKLLRSIYVDDVVTGTAVESEALTLYTKAKELLREGGFNLRKFATNSSKLQREVDSKEAIGSSDVPNEHKELDETYLESALGSPRKLWPGEQKVLGIRWSVESDELVISLSGIARLAMDQDPTRRSIVSLVGKFYDPLGFLAPIVVRFKMFIQRLCEAALGWDEPLTETLLQQWQTLSSKLQEGLHFSIPRCYFSDCLDEVTSCQLCGFCDASCKAFAAVVYLRVETRTGCSMKFVAAKTRVAPLKTQTIPRLELLSALLLSRLIASVTRSLEGDVNLSAPICYTDSKVALFWIQGTDKSWKPFVHNRVTEIRGYVPVDCWKHCPGAENPADVPSRGATPLELSANLLWHNGPTWLMEKNLQTPEPDLPMPQACLEEMKAKDIKLIQGLLTTSQASGIGRLMKSEDISTLNRLLNVTSQVLRFCQAMKSKIDPRISLDADELRARAEILWIKEAQSSLIDDKHFEDWKRQLGLFRDNDGLWRCRGRLSNADLPTSTKHPILLPKSHHLTHLFVKWAHERVFHNGVRDTLTELRSRFWVVKGRSLVRRILHHCTLCRRFEGRSYETPRPPPLPAFRVTEAPPFTFTGIDFAGPLYIKDTQGGQKKAWICLYTCCVVRAVHLDLVTDMSVQTFLRSFKRFTSRRGLPSRIVSDNGKTFRAAAKILKAVSTSGEASKYFSEIGVQWVFNVPKAPWWGGLFERMVRSVKRCLRKIIGRASLSLDELLTAVIEVEAVVNSRPLTYVSSDDFAEPLTPSHLLTGRRIMNLPDRLRGEVSDDDVDQDVLGRRARHLSHVLDRFWKRWKNEYLLELRSAHRHDRGKEDASPVSVGDLVVIHDDNQPRGFWKLGKVEQVMTGRDGLARGAVVRVANKGRQATRLTRPIQKLFPLEVPYGKQSTRKEIPPLHSPDCLIDESEVIKNETPRRPTRAAAQEARDRMLAQVLSEDI